MMYEATLKCGSLELTLKAPTAEKLVCLVALYEAWEKTPAGETFEADNAYIVKPADPPAAG